MSRPSTCGEDITCQNSGCAFYLLKAGKRIVKKGFSSAGRQVYMCRHCNGNFVETINTPMYYRHISMEQVTLIGKLANEKVGVRASERITGINKDTVMRVVRDLACYAESLEDSKAVGLNHGVEHEVDELWTFFKKRETCRVW